MSIYIKISIIHSNLVYIVTFFVGKYKKVATHALLLLLLQDMHENAQFELCAS